jgi:hypothetical protein
VLISATVVEEPTKTNTIDVVFNENLNLFTVHAPVSPVVLSNDTFRVVMFGSNIVIGISNAVYKLAPPALPKVTLQVNTASNWFARSNYYIIVNNVRDARGNIIAPNSVVPVSWPMSTNIFTPGSQTWLYHANWLNDMLDLGVNIYTNSWWLPSYTESPSWGGPVGNVLYHDQENTNETCFLGVPLQDIGTQDQPTLLRTWFMWPTNASTNVTLKFDYAADDTARFYLNGDLLFSDAAFPPGPITSDTRATSGSEAICKTNIISNVALRRGSNLLAVAVAQFRPPAPGATDQPFDMVWALQLDAIGYQTSPLPRTSLTNRITWSHPLNPFSLVMSWPTNAYGWALVYSTNVTTNKILGTNQFSRPLIQETNMQNTLGKPTVITNFPGPRRFYELVPTQDRSLFP